MPVFIKVSYNRINSGVKIPEKYNSDEFIAVLL